MKRDFTSRKWMGLSRTDSNDQLEKLRRDARAIFDAALTVADARQAIHDAIELNGSQLRVFGNKYDLAKQEIVVVSLGKAAPAMFTGLVEILGERIRNAVVSGPIERLPSSFTFPSWRFFDGGHPYPNQQSLDAGKAALDIVKDTNSSKALQIFLVSGGGSSMMEVPLTTRITLNDLLEANRILVNCGATISEINAVRRAFSSIKGGRLAAHAPEAQQLTLIVSDTNADDEHNVASGPTVSPPVSAISANEVVNQYGLRAILPASIVETIATSESSSSIETGNMRKHFVLLDNRTAIDAAAAKALELNYDVAIGEDISEQEIEEGSHVLIERLRQEWLKHPERPLCLISGGEFSCMVRGGGLGGRNSETVLRCAIELSRRSNPDLNHRVILSAGTDGIDGNSPAAGAICDESSVARAQEIGLDAQRFLNNSDSFRFFEHLNSTIITGPTGSNVRDIRILLGSK